VLNAVAGEEIASVGRIRPHTERPLAWIPDDGDATLVATLDHLGIRERHTHRRMGGVALLDLPDMDSVAFDHRMLVEELIPRVDGLVWVLDPEKYHDPALHDAFLAPLAGYAFQSAFVLNKIDLLGDGARAEVVPDVRRLLDELGYEAAPLFPVAASPGSGRPEGIEPFVEYLEGSMDRKRVSYGKLLADLAAVVRTLGTAAGVWKGGGIRLEGRWTVTREAAIAALRPGSPLPGEDALCRVEDLVAAAAAEVGGHIGEVIRSELDHDAILEALTEAQVAVGAGDVPAARKALDAGVGDVMHREVWHKAHFAALVAHAHTGIRQVASRFDVTVL
jgi:hypothetical protein